MPAKITGYTVLLFFLINWWDFWEITHMYSWTLLMMVKHAQASLGAEVYPAIFWPVMVWYQMKLHAVQVLQYLKTKCSLTAARMATDNFSFLNILDKILYYSVATVHNIVRYWLQIISMHAVIVWSCSYVQCDSRLTGYLHQSQSWPDIVYFDSSPYH